MRGPVRDIRGLTLLEIIVTMAVVSVVMGSIVMFMDRVIHFKGTADTIQRFKKIESALEVLYGENIRYIEDNCYGWTDSSCSSLTALPIMSTSDANHRTLIIATHSTSVPNLLREAGCTAASSDSVTYTVTCLDGYGSPFTFATTNEHSAGTFYLNGYNRTTPYGITITSGGNTSMSDTWTSGHLDSERMVRSQEKILTIARAMKSYHLSRLTVESVRNPCSASGGLASNDDIFIPWIWQALGSSPTTNCTGITSGNCGCSAFNASVWPTDAASNIVNTATTITSFLNAISAGSAYRVDGFGNPVTIVLLATSAGSSVGSAPTAPSPSYSWSVNPPYAGLVAVMNGGTVIYSERVVYVH